ncbi:hypothetical protein N2152v2_001493 [Parachlorella kessleri]
MAAPHIWPGHKRGSKIGTQQAHTWQLSCTQALACRPRRVLVLSSQQASSSSIPPTALQQRLAEAGVADWQAFCQPRYSTLASESEVESVAAKVVELCREGLAAGDLELLFQQQSSPGISDLQAVFLPNMAYLRELLAGERIVTTPYEPPGLTPLGRLLRNQPASMGKVLNRSPSRLAELDAWLSVTPDLLVKDLGGPVQQQKLQWAHEQLGWSLAKLLSERFFGRSLLRMASRLAFMRQLGLPDPGNLQYIGIVREPVFLARVSKAAGREVSTAEFAEWVAAWLRTSEGQRWGFKPQKVKRARQPKG